MQRAIRTALLTAIQNLGLYYYSSPPSRHVASSWLGIVAEFDSDADIFDRTRGSPNSMRGRKALEPLLRAREQAARTAEGCVRNAFTSGSPLCRGWTRATYILCIEHPRPKCLSRELNPGPPALQANTLCKEPFQRRYWLLFGTLACTTTIAYYMSHNNIIYFISRPGLMRSQ